MNSRSLSIAIVSFLIGTSALSAGCGDSGETTTGTMSSSSSSGSGGTGGTGGSGGTGGTGGKVSAPETVAAFDPSKGQFVEGLDIKDGIAYVGAVLTGEVFTVDLAKHDIKHHGAMPAFTQNQGALVGLTLGSDGAVYAALNITNPAGPKTGIYKIPAGGGTATLFASDPAMVFANDVRFDDAGNLFATDSMSGSVFKIAKDGTVTKWLSHMLLTPDPTVCGVQTNFHLGINGIVRNGDAYYATNTDRASIVKIPVNADGSAGTPEIFLPTDCATLSGVDGIAVDEATGDLIVAINYKDTVVRIGKDKAIKNIASGDPLQSPASLYIDAPAKAVYVTSAAFAALATDPSKAKPALVKLPLE
ncbi:MAG: SMP-30/gluconolactonase/LRE family protein [Minicystis sp.]